MLNVAVGRMGAEDARKKILDTVAVVAKTEPGSLTGLERLEDLENWDSLAAIDFLMAAGGDIESEGLEKCQTVEDLVKLVIGQPLKAS